MSSLKGHFPGHYKFMDSQMKYTKIMFIYAFSADQLDLLNCPPNKNDIKK